MERMDERPILNTEPSAPRGRWQPGRPFAFKAAKLVRKALTLSGCAHVLPADDVLPEAAFIPGSMALRAYETSLRVAMDQPGIDDDERADIGNDLMLVEAIRGDLEEHCRTGSDTAERDGQGKRFPISQARPGRRAAGRA